MKTKRRHELQTNQLADSLARWIEVVKPYSRALLALVVTVVVAIFAWGYLSAQNNRNTAEGWNAIFEAMNSRNADEELANISSHYAGTPVGIWARITIADLQLNRGTNQLLVDKGLARDELRKATGEYQAIQLDTQEPMLLQRATFGLARAHEALGTPNDLESARKEYRSIGEKWPDSPYAQDAQRRAEDLDRTATKNFYDWLARYEPPRAVANELGARPDFLQDPLEGSGITLPSAIDDATSLPSFGDEPSSGPLLGGEPDSQDAPSDEAPAPTDDPPAETPDERAEDGPPPASTDNDDAPSATDDEPPSPE